MSREGHLPKAPLKLTDWPSVSLTSASASTASAAGILYTSKAYWALPTVAYTMVLAAFLSSLSAFSAGPETSACNRYRIDSHKMHFQFHPLTIVWHLPVVLDSLLPMTRIPTAAEAFGMLPCLHLLLHQSQGGRGIGQSKASDASSLALRTSLYIVRFSVTVPCDPT